MNETVAEQAWHIAEPLVKEEGLEIVDVEYRRESRGMVLRFYLDRDGGSGGVSLDDLTRVSRQLGDLLDVHDTVPNAYNLEVSSPGINRRLRLPDHFRRYLGEPIRIRTIAAVNGRRSFVGVLTAVETDGVVLREAEGEQRVRFADIAHANYEAEREVPRRE